MSDDVIPASPTTNVKNKKRKFRRKRNVKMKLSKPVLHSENDCPTENIDKIYSDFSALFPRCSQWFDEIPDQLKHTEKENQLNYDDCDSVLEQHKSYMKPLRKNGQNLLSIQENEVSISESVDLVIEPEKLEIAETVDEEEDLFSEVIASEECDFVVASQKLEIEEKTIESPPVQTKLYPLIDDCVLPKEQVIEFVPETQFVNEVKKEEVPIPNDGNTTEIRTVKENDVEIVMDEQEINSDQVNKQSVISSNVELQQIISDTLSQFPVNQLKEEEPFIQFPIPNVGNTTEIKTVTENDVEIVMDEQEINSDQVNKQSVISSNVKLQQITIPVQQEETKYFESLLSVVKSPPNMDFLYDTNDSPDIETSNLPESLAVPFFAKALILECANQNQFNTFKPPPKIIQFPAQPFQSAKQFSSQYLPASDIAVEATENHTSQELRRLLDDSIPFYFPELIQVPEINDSTHLQSRNETDYKSMLDEDQDLFDDVMMQLHPSDENDTKKSETPKASKHINCENMLPMFSTGRGAKIHIISDAAVRKSETIFQNINDEIDAVADARIPNASKRKFNDILLSPRKPFDRIENDSNLNVPKMLGFIAAGGNKSSISAMAVQKATSICNDIEKEFPLENFDDNAPSMKKHNISDMSPLRLNRPIALLTCSPSAPAKLQNNESYSQILTKEVAEITRAFLEDENKNYKWSQEHVKRRIEKEFSIYNKTNQIISHQEHDNTSNRKIGGFQTARGNVISISTNALKQSTAVFHEIEKEFHIDNETNPTMSSCNETRDCHLNGFQKATSNQISTSTNAQKRPTTVLSKIENEFSTDNENNQTISNRKTCLVNDNAGDRKIGGFQTARGNLISISTNALKQSTAIFNEIENEFPIDTETKFAMSKCDMLSVDNEIRDRHFNGFQTATNNHIPSSTTMLNKIDNENKQTIFNRTETDRKIGGFQTARGNKISISTNALKQSTAIFNEIENEFPIDTATTEQNCIIKNGFKKTVDKADNLLKKSEINPNGDFQTATRNKIGVNVSESVKRLSTTFREFNTNISKIQDPNSFSSPSSSKRSRGPLMTSTPVITLQNGQIYSPRFTKELNDITKAFLDDEIENCSNIVENVIENFKPLPSRLKPTRLSTIFESFDREIQLPITVSKDVIIQRQNSLHLQQNKSMDHDQLKMSTSCRPGYLYLKKLLLSKISLKEFVGAKLPYSDRTSITCDNNSPFMMIQNETFKNFKFNMIEHYAMEICQENTDGIQLNDDMLLIMNEHCQVGYTELKSSFYACPHVNPLKISNHWYDNHFKWILWKFLALEYAFPNKFRQKLLTPKNVLEQLKYRYDRDVIQSEMSVIRKLIENNGKLPYDRPLFVCFVSKILSDNDIELSDGWYAINCKLDAILCTAVASGKIQIGTKLIVWCTDILTDLPVNCSVLQIPSNVRLKINANACRRVKWDTKLGLYKLTHSFYIKLSSIYINGGIIGCIKVQVLRIISSSKDFDSPKKLSLRKRRQTPSESIDIRPKKSLKLNNKTPSPTHTSTCTNVLMQLEICDINLPLKVYQLNICKMFNNTTMIIREHSIIEVTNLIACDIENYEMQLITTDASCIKLLS